MVVAAQYDFNPRTWETTLGIVGHETDLGSTVELTLLAEVQVNKPENMGLEDQAPTIICHMVVRPRERCPHLWQLGELALKS